MKLLIRRLLNIFGYDIIKVTPTYLFKRYSSIIVAGNRLNIPVNNPLIKTYTEMPLFGQEIGRISKEIYKKYPSMWAIDIGANIGDSTSIIKKFSDIPVVSIEGDETSYKYLKQNTTLFKNIFTYNKYLGENDEERSVIISKKGWNNTIMPNTNSGKKIQFITLDSLIKENFLSEIQFKFIKIDTEGYDTIIIRGGREIIRNKKPVIYLEFNQDNMASLNENGLKTIFSLSEYGYKSVLFFDDRGRFIISIGLNETEKIEQLCKYSDGKNGLIYYYNLCLIQEEDSELVAAIVNSELKNSEEKYCS
jgi:FkbM family methyltransferase